jgi:hypothetical protein
MLEKVSETELIPILEDTARVHRKAQEGPIAGFGVLAYVVGEPVGKLAHDHVGVNGKNRGVFRGIFGGGFICHAPRIAGG